MDNQKQFEPRPDSPSLLKTMKMKRRLSWIGLLFCLTIVLVILTSGLAMTQDDVTYIWVALFPLIIMVIVGIGFVFREIIFPEELVEANEGQDE